MEIFDSQATPVGKLIYIGNLAILFSGIMFKFDHIKSLGPWGEIAG